MRIRILVLGALLLSIILACPAVTLGQLRDQSPTEKPNVYDSMVKPADVGDLLFGFFNPDNLTMHHSYSLSYYSVGGKGIALGMYTNSMLYQISNPLRLRVDWSLAYSPFSSFGKQFQNSLSGLFLNRAELDYQPSKDVRINLQFRQVPGGYYSNPLYRGFYDDEEFLFGR